MGLSVDTSVGASVGNSVGVSAGNWGGNSVAFRRLWAAWRARAERRAARSIMSKYRRRISLSPDHLHKYCLE